MKKYTVRKFLVLSVFLLLPFLPGPAQTPAYSFVQETNEPSPINNRIVVKYRDSVTSCVHCLLKNRQRLKDATTDRSDSLDELHTQLGITAARPVFRTDTEEKALKRGNSGALSLDTLKQADINQRSRVAKKFRARAARAPKNATPPSLHHVYSLTLPADIDIDEALRAFRADTHVEYAQPDYEMTPYSVPNDPYYSSQNSWGQNYDDLWNVKRIGAATAWDTTQGEGIVVGVIDTGLDYNHPDIAANVWTNPGEIPSNHIDDDGNGYVDDVRGWDFSASDNDPMDGYGHGTHVSGTIGAVGNNNLGIIGVAPAAKIMPVKGFSDTGAGSTSALAEAMVYAAENGADVLNNSWGCSSLCPYNPVAEDAVLAAYQLGSVIVFAAGNSDADTIHYSPQNMTTPKPIVVASTENNDSISYFSNFGLTLDVAAPGSGFDSAPPDFDPFRGILSLKSAATQPAFTGNGQLVVGNNYVRQAGTSMAAPHAAGVVALLLKKQPAFTHDQVRQALRFSATDLGTFGSDTQSGAGLINAAPAVNITTNSILNVSITGPLSGSAFTISSSGSIPITGTASGSGFWRYELYSGVGLSPISWSAIGPVVNNPVTNGLLGTWSIANLAPNMYWIKLIATSAAGKKYEALTRVFIERPVELVALDADFQRPADVSGNRIVWGRKTGPVYNIYLYDMDTHTEYAVTSDGKAKSDPSISGDLIVWADSRTGYSDIYLFDLAAGQEEQITTNAAHQYYPKIDGTRIVWTDERNGNQDVYLYDLTTHQERQITSHAADQRRPDISGDFVVWMDERNGQWDIYALNLLTNLEERLTTHPATQWRPRISGNRVVWEDERNGHRDIYLYNLTTHTEQRITSNAAYQNAPEIDGDFIVWDDDRNGLSDIYLFDLATSSEKRITVHPSSQTFPVISDRRIVWLDTRGGGSDLYTTVLDRVKILSPTAGAVLTKQGTPSVDITGFAMAQGFEQYELIYGSGYTPATWVSITGPVSTPAQGGLLGTWPIDNLANGLYQLRLVVTTAGGNQFFDTVGVNIEDYVPPQAIIQTPVDGTQINQFYNSSINIMGTAVGSGFYHYQLFYSPNIPSPIWAPIDVGLFPRVGILGTWNIASLAPFNYLIRLVVTFTNGSQISDETSVSIVNINQNVGTPIAASGLRQGIPCISGNLVAFSVNPGTVNSQVSVYDISTQTVQTIATGERYLQNLNISGNKIIWTAEDATALKRRVYVYDLTNNIKQTATSDPNTDVASAQIDGNRIVSIDGYNTSPHRIFLFDLSTGQESLLSLATGQAHHIAIYGNNVAWTDYLRDSFNNLLSTNIYLHDLAAGTGQYIVTQTAQANIQNLDMDGDRLVWADNRNGNFDIYMRDLSTGIEYTITNDSAYEAKPKISGDWIVWTDLSSGNGDIYGYYIPTQEKHLIVGHPSLQYSPDISGNQVVWEDYRSGSSTPNIYLYDISGLVDINDPPIISPIQHVAVQVGQLLTFPVYANDPDGDTLTLTAEQSNGQPLNALGASFTDNGGGTGTFSWTPASNHPGAHSFIFKANDGLGGIGTKTMTVDVTPREDSWYQTTAPALVAAGEQLGFQVYPSYLHPGENVTVSVDPATMPENAYFFADDFGGAFPGNYIFFWAPVAEPLGPRTIRFTATNGSEVSTTNVTVNVTEGSFGSVDFGLSPTSVTGTVNQLLFIPLWVSYSSGPGNYELDVYPLFPLPENAHFDRDSLTLIWDVPTQPGPYEVVFVGTFGAAAATHKITINIGAPPPPPTGGGGTCFLAGTPITLLKGGVTKPIEEIKVGDQVASGDFETNRFEVGTVTKIFVHNDAHKGYFEINDMKITEEHPIWVIDKGWVEAKDILLGDRLLTVDLKEESVTHITFVPGKFTVYNFEVEPYHTYFANSKLVHNKKVRVVAPIENDGREP